MHGLPNQTVEDAVFDISQAIAMKPTHISWYQLTIEPNTLFAVKTPTLPDENTLESIETLGKDLLAKADFDQYEVSAYAKNKNDPYITQITGVLVTILVLVLVLTVK